MPSFRAYLLLLALSGTALAAPEIERHRATVKVEKGGLRVTANDELTVRRGDGEPLVISLNSGLEISSVLVDGAALEGREKLSDDGSTARWSLPLPAGDEERLLVSISYAGTVWQRGSRSSPLGGATLPDEAAWIPTDRRATEWSVRLDVPAELHTLMPGVRGARTESNDRASVTWSSSGPWRRVDLLLAPVAPSETEIDGVTIGIWALPDAAPPSDVDAESVRTRIAALSMLYGRFPLPRFDVIAADGTWRRAMPGIALARPETRADNIEDALMAVWFGGLLGDGDARGAWARGLRAYERYYRLREESAPTSARLFREMMSTSVDAAAVPGFHDVRTAATFHALRREVGEEAYERALADLLRDRAGEVIAWRDWSTALSRAAGRDVSDHVDQWSTRPGLPRLLLTDLRLEAAAGRQRLAGTVRQVLGPGAAPWRVSVPVVVETIDGRETTRVEISSQETGFTMLIPSLALRVALDPELQLPHAVDRDRGVVWRPVLPDVRSDSDPRRVTSLMRRLAETEDATQLVLEELMIAGFDVDESTVEALLLERAEGCSLTVGGLDIVQARPLTASPRTPEDGVTASAIATDPGDDLTGGALVLDLPSSSPDVLEFVRGAAGIAAGSGATLMIVRLPAVERGGVGALWATAEDIAGPDAGEHALRAQMNRAPPLPLPVFAVPRDTDLTGGAVRATVDWTERDVSGRSLALRLTAPRAMAGDVVLAARLPDEHDQTAAIALIEAVQILASHTDLLGRSVRIVFLPSGPAAVWADERLARSRKAGPALFVGRVGDRGFASAALAATPDAELLARLVAASCERATVETLTRDVPSSTIGPRTVVLTSHGLDVPGSEPGAKKIGRMARAIALSVIAASIAP